MEPILSVKFYASESGNEPVREWLRSLSPQEKKTIGEDIKTVQFGWPLGMPLVDHIDGEIWEVRVKLENRIARILFAVVASTMVLLHGFIKKTPKTPLNELETARKRLRKLKGRES